MLLPSSLLPSSDSFWEQYNAHLIANQSDSLNRADATDVGADDVRVEDARVPLLDDTAQFISHTLAESGQSLHLNFICTHNSRRSHFSQFWAAAAASAFGLGEILPCVSGGTEATACNERVIASLKRVGVSVETEKHDVDCSDTKIAHGAAESQMPNPLYLARFDSDSDTAPIRLFSKLYSDAVPDSDTPFVAMMCCDHVDETCPLIPGAIRRVPLHYRDPKISDGTPQQEETYDQRRDQIAIEMIYLMRKVRDLHQAIKKKR